MRSIRPNYFVLFLFLILFAGLAIAFHGDLFSFQKNKIATSAPSRHIASVLAQMSPSASHQASSQGPISIPPMIGSTEPSPLDHASQEELKEFPGARVVQFEESEGPELGQKTHTRILQTQFKYPYIRTEEIIDASNGALIVRAKMVADHFLVNLQEGETPDHFLNAFGPQATAITR